MVKHNNEMNGMRNVLFIHGYASSDTYFKLMKKTEHKFNMISVNLPISGQKMMIEDYVKFIDDFVEEIKLENFDVVGHSLGAAIAIKIKKAENTILISPLYPYAKPIHRYLLPSTKEEAFEAMSNLLFDYKTQWNEKEINEYAKRLLAYTNRNKKYLIPLVTEQISNEKYLKNELIKSYDNKNPIFIIGENDKYINPDGLYKFAKDKNYIVHTVKKCGHSPIYEKPKEVIKLIHKILNL